MIFVLIKNLAIITFNSILIDINNRLNLNILNALIV